MVLIRETTTGKLTLKSRLSTRVDIVLDAIKQIIHIFIQDTVFF